VNL
jgi:hypothetical protein